MTDKAALDLFTGLAVQTQQLVEELALLGALSWSAPCQLSLERLVNL